MTPSTRLFAAAAFTVLAAAPAARAEEADLTKANRVVCAPERMGLCKTGNDCEWKAASARDKTRPLVIDFGAHQAYVRRDGKDRPFGAVVNDRADGPARRFAVRRQEGNDPPVTIEMSLDRTGKLKGSRAAGRLRIEAQCTAS